MTEIRDRFPDRPTLVKATGMLGSARLMMASAPRRLYSSSASAPKIGASWSQLIVQVILPA
jgi:hypothetical protein